MRWFYMSGGAVALIAGGCVGLSAQPLDGSIVKFDVQTAAFLTDVPYVTLKDRRPSYEKRGSVEPPNKNRPDRIAIRFAAENFEPLPFDRLKQEIASRLVTWPKPVASAIVEVESFQVKIVQVNSAAQETEDNRSLARKVARDRRRENEQEVKRREEEEQQSRPYFMLAANDQSSHRDKSWLEMILGPIFEGLRRSVEDGLESVPTGQSAMSNASFDNDSAPNRQDIFCRMQLTIQVVTTDNQIERFPIVVETMSYRLLAPNEIAGLAVANALESAIRDAGDHVVRHVSKE